MFVPFDDRDIILLKVLRQTAIATLDILLCKHILVELIAMHTKATSVDVQPLAVMDHVISHQEQESVAEAKLYNQQQVSKRST